MSMSLVSVAVEEELARFVVLTVVDVFGRKRRNATFIVILLQLTAGFSSRIFPRKRTIFSNGAEVEISISAK